MGRRTLEVWLPIAGAIHLALAFAASRLPLPVPPPTSAAIDLVEEPATIALEPPATPAALAVAGASAPGTPGATSVPGGSFGAPKRAAASDAPPGAEGTDGVVAGAGSWSFTTAAAPNLRAVSPLYGAPPVEPPPAPATPTSRTGGLAEGLDERDQARGLGRGGPVLSAVEEVARVPGESAPEGHATFEVTVHRSGTVNVSVRDATDGTWEALREAIVRQVSAKHVSLPSNAEGMRFTIKIDARVQWPDGKRPADMGTKPVWSTGPTELAGKPRSQPGLSFQNVPMIGVVHEGKVCSVGLAAYPGFVAIGGACSPENIGQPPARIVHGRIEKEARL